MKADIELMEYLVAEMKRAQAEHPKAKIYYDWEDRELRITYPLPHDFNKNSISDFSDNHLDI